MSVLHDGWGLNVYEVVCSNVCLMRRSCFGFVSMSLGFEVEKRVSDADDLSRNLRETVDYYSQQSTDFHEYPLQSRLNRMTVVKGS